MQAEAVAMQAGNGGDSGRKLRLLTLADLDGRTRARQRAEELRERVISERGGPDQIDVMRAAHTDTWALLTAMIEDLMARYILGEPVEPSSVATLINARRREGEAIGEPTPRDVTPSLAQYLASKRAAAVDAVSAPAATDPSPAGEQRAGGSPADAGDI